MKPPATPEPSADQLLPFHLTIRLAAMPPARQRELAPHIQICACHCQRKRRAATHSCAQRRPTAAVPLGDVVGGGEVRRSEIPPRVNITAPNGQRVYHRATTAEPVTQRVPGSAAPLGDVMARAAPRRCEPAH